MLVYKRGFTLIEIVTALAIMGIGILSILALFPVGFHASSRAADFTQATFYAQGKIEEIKMKGFNSLDDFDGQKEKEGKFEREVKISVIPGYDNMKEVEVKVSWPERGQEREEAFKTYIVDYAP